MENHHLWWIYPLNMVIFHSYVSLPEGNCRFKVALCYYSTNINQQAMFDTLNSMACHEPEFHHYLKASMYGFAHPCNVGGYLHVYTHIVFLVISVHIYIHKPVCNCVYISIQPIHLISFNVPYNIPDHGIIYIILLHIYARISHISMNDIPHGLTIFGLIESSS